VGHALPQPLAQMSEEQRAAAAAAAQAWASELARGQALLAAALARAEAADMELAGLQLGGGAQPGRCGAEKGGGCCGMQWPKAGQGRGGDVWMAGAADGPAAGWLQWPQQTRVKWGSFIHYLL
jgi:hypothetical protein